MLRDRKSNAVKYRNFVSVLIEQEVKSPVCQMENYEMGGEKKGIQACNTKIVTTGKCFI